MPNRSTRPGLGHLTSIVLACVLAVLATIAAIALTTVDATDRGFPNSVIGAVDTLAGVSIISAIVLAANWSGQMRILRAIDDLRGEVASLRLSTTDLQCDTVEIKGGLWQLGNAVGRVRVPYESIEDRDTFAKVLATPAQKPDEYTEREWRIYMSGVFDGRGGDGEGGEPSPN